LENNNSFKRASDYSQQGLKNEASKLAEILGVTLPHGNGEMNENRALYEHKVSIDKVIEYINSQGMRISNRMVRRYHLSLINKGFLILSGVSGTGKTWLAELYAKSIDANFLVVPVAPNWTTNEDLLGFYNPLDDQYKHTSFSTFITDAQNEYASALKEDRIARPYHIILDEMNLARVEYYFAKFLSLLELRNRGEEAAIDIPPDEKIVLTPNLFFIGTINVDETTHGFADKVYDRAQLIEMEIGREEIVQALGEEPYSLIVIKIWDTIHKQAPFAHRVINDIKKYIEDAIELDIDWKIALDEQILQKILPKIKGTSIDIGSKLEELKIILEEEELELSYSKLEQMLERYGYYGVVTYF
jgi:MoxR-like ATPase